jgi:hypothetical protein
MCDEMIDAAFFIDNRRGKEERKLDFRVEHEIKVVRTVLKRVHGPCLICTRVTEYGKRIPPLDMVWLRKQFEPDTLRRDVRAVRIGVAPKGR